MIILNWLTTFITNAMRILLKGGVWVLRNYKNRRFWIGLSLLSLMIIGVAVGYRVLNPPIVVSPDATPFETMAEYDAFIEQNPLITAEVPKDEKFIKTAQIREDKQVVYTIELSQRPIKPQMDMAYVESYLSYLQNSQDEAKQWIKDLGLNPDELAIIWRPDPSEMRTKMLGESTKSLPQKDVAPPVTASPTPTQAPRFPQ